MSETPGTGAERDAIEALEALEKVRAAQRRSWMEGAAVRHRDKFEATERVSNEDEQGQGFAG